MHAKITTSPNVAPASLADHARDFHRDFDAAFHVFGNVNGNAKHPLAKGGIATATRDRAELERRCLNPKATGYCVYPGDFIVIDIDVGEGKDGRAHLAALAAEHGEKIPVTAFVASPPGNGSGHLYFNISEGELIPSSNGKIAPGVDVRGNDGAYWIAGPGSRTDKGEYRWGRGPESMIDAPQWLLDAAKAARPRARDRAAPKALPPCVGWDDPRNIERFVTWLRDDAKPSIEGQGGNDTLAATGAMGSSLALYEETTIQLMADHWNSRCEPPWDDDELAYYGGSGYRSAENVGNMATKDYAPLFRAATTERLRLAAINGERITEPCAATGGGALLAYSLDDLETIPDPAWLVDRMMPEGGYSLVYGKRSAKKSFIALDLALSVATGTEYHGRETKRGRAVYFAGEGFRGLRRRIAAWFKARGLDRKDYGRDFFLVPFTSKWDRAADREKVRQALAEISKDGSVSLVVVDTARRAMSGDENTPTAVGQFLDGVSDISREHGCASLIVHHAGKDETKGARGGGPFEDDADAVFHVTKLPGGTRLKCTKQKDDEDGWALNFRGDVIDLGKDAAGKPVTSLALTLEGEEVSDDETAGDVPSSGSRDQYTIHDATAARILDGLEDPFAGRGALAVAVMAELAPELRETDPNAFTKAMRAYGAHLTRLSPASALWRYVGEKNAKGEPLNFVNPNERGRRAPKPGRRRGALNYVPLRQRDAADE